MTLTEHVIELQRQIEVCIRGIPADLPEFARSLYNSSDQEQARQARKHILLRDMEDARRLLESALRASDGC